MPELTPHPAAGRLLGETLVQAIDGYFEARARLIRALAAGDEPAAQTANAESRQALGTWLALLVERLDSRSASLLVDVLRRLENLEALLDVAPGRPRDDVDDPTGHDAGRGL